VIDKLIAFEASEGARYTLHVRRPANETATAVENS
jgi:hypothetical protein